MRGLHYGVMKATLIVLTAAVVTAGCGGTRTVTRTVTVDRTAKTGIGPPREVVFYGHIKSLRRDGRRFELRFDPAWFLSGSAAEHAAVEDKVLQPGEPVPNDNYTVEEGHRLLTFVVFPNAHVSVLTKGLQSTAIPVAELAEILAGKNPQHRALFDPSNHSAFWIRVGEKYPNPVIALDQQYHP
jgi:hypothetical protein